PRPLGRRAGRPARRRSGAPAPHYAAPRRPPLGRTRSSRAAPSPLTVFGAHADPAAERTSLSQPVTAGSVFLRADPPTSNPMWPALTESVSARADPTSPASGDTESGGVTWSWVPYTLRNGQVIDLSLRGRSPSRTSPVYSALSRLSLRIISTNAA